MPYAKILDFGLAKLVTDAPPSSIAPTAVAADLLTSPGAAIGTVGYMSPEQALGKDMDPRTDIFSLGVVLYEMSTGSLPFKGDTSAGIFDEILNKQPLSPARVNPELPQELERIIFKALEKDREVRYQSARDLEVDLKRLKRDTESARSGVRVAVSAQPEKKSGIRWLSAVAALLVLTLGGIASYVYFSPEPASPTTGSTVQFRAVPLTSLPGVEQDPAFSPEGDRIAYARTESDGSSSIDVQLIGAGSPLRLTHGSADHYPVWSPDGRYLAFSRSSGSDPGIYLLASLGGSERRLTQVPAFEGLHWSPDGKYLALADRESESQPASIFLVSVDTGERERLTSPPPGSYSDRLPAFSPDGQMVAFVRSPNFLVDDLYIQPVAAGEPRRLTFDERIIRGLTWTPDSQSLIFSSNRAGLNQLWKIAGQGGTAHPLAGPGDNAIQPAVAHVGNRLAYTMVVSNSDLWRVELAPHSSGQAERFISSTKADGSASYSPDGKKIAFGSERSGSSEIWVCDSDGAHPVQLTDFRGPHTGTPRWSPDGQWIAFDSRLEGHSDIFTISSRGGTPRRLTSDKSADIVPAWSEDGQWIYFGSNRGGSSQIWKMPSKGGPATQVTSKGGYAAIASRDGYLYYSVTQRGISRVPVNGGEEIVILPEVFWGYCAVFPDGIYYPNPKAKPRPTIDFYSFATKTSTPVTTCEPTASVGGGPGFSVSPDRRWAVYMHRTSQSDIMLVENFQ